jgi:hypothetical protein
MTLFNKNGVSLSARSYYSLRLHLHRKRWLLRLVQILRAYVLFGPLRKPIVLYYQKFSNNGPIKVNTYSIFPHVDANQLVKRLNNVGYAPVGILAEEYVAQILDYCETHKRTSYWNLHENCEAVNHICWNVKVVEIARQYLGVEPILWLTQLKWSFPAHDEHLDLHASIHKEPIPYDTHAFHYDNVDFKSLTLFIYLTDIDSDAGAHVVIEGTHEHKTWKDIKNSVLDDDVAQQKFGDKIKAILGKKGTAFFEETSSYHKVAACENRRLILSIDYVLQRKVPPERPVLGDYP